MSAADVGALLERAPRWPHALLCWRSSYTLMPSLSQRGILLCVMFSVTTCPNSCHSIDSQFDGRSAFGLLAVMTLPKHTPRKPSPPGIPNVRIAKSC